MSESLGILHADAVHADCNKHMYWNAKT